MNLSKIGIFELASNFFPTLRDLKLINTGLESLDKLNQIKTLASLNLSRNQIRIQNQEDLIHLFSSYKELDLSKNY